MKCSNSIPSSSGSGSLIVGAGVGEVVLLLFPSSSVTGLISSLLSESLSIVFAFSA